MSEKTAYDVGFLSALHIVIDAEAKPLGTPRPSGQEVVWLGFRVAVVALCVLLVAVIVLWARELA